MSNSSAVDQILPHPVPLLGGEWTLGIVYIHNINFCVGITGEIHFQTVGVEKELCNGLVFKT